MGSGPLGLSLSGLCTKPAVFPRSTDHHTTAFAVFVFPASMFEPSRQWIDGEDGRSQSICREDDSELRTSNSMNTRKQEKEQRIERNLAMRSIYIIYACNRRMIYSACRPTLKLGADADGI